MFEKSEPSAAAKARRISARELPDCDSIRAQDAGVSKRPDGNALRAIEWSELTARLGAARDFRLLLRDELDAKEGCGDASFAEAAARYFRAREGDEGDINLVDLEHCKGSSGMVQGSGRQSNEPTHAAEHAQSGEAREEQ